MDGGPYRHRGAYRGHLVSRDFKPGDVAMVNGSVSVRADHVWHTSTGVLSDHNVTHVRPLVVIDPEDREQINHMQKVWDVWGLPKDLLIDSLQAAFRALAAPPKPDEPQGKYAEVENSEGMTYYRSPSGEWHRATDDFVRPWSHVGAVRILSEGVQP